jgi:hypothetical protein
VLAAVLVLFFGVGGWFYAWECNRRVRVPSDPRTAFGLPFREVSYASELGPTRPGSSAAARDLGAVRARLQRPRREALRLLRVVADEGFPALVLSTVTILGPRPAQTACAAGGRPSGATSRRRPASPWTTAPPVWSWSATAWAGCGHQLPVRVEAGRRGSRGDPGRPRGGGPGRDRRPRRPRPHPPAPGTPGAGAAHRDRQGHRRRPLRPWTGAAWTTTGSHPSPTDPLRHLQQVGGRGVTRGRGSMRAWQLDLVRFR